MEQYHTPPAVAELYAASGALKARRKSAELFLLAVLAGALIAFACAATSTAVYGLQDTWTARTVCALLFPFGLAMVILSGAELFTGNCLMIIPVLSHRCTARGMLRNWALVWLGNLTGALLVAAGCVYSGQLDYSNGALAVYTLRLAAAKCALPFPRAVLLGILCNVLVTLAVLFALSGLDNVSRILGAWMPVCFFVLCGFEHSIANMYYIGAGLYALKIPAYARMALEAGLDLSGLNLSGFLLHNLLPVTLGNILGGAVVSWLYWTCYLRAKR